MTSAAWSAEMGGASEPRIALKMQVQMRDVMATTGIRRYMGEKVKLKMVAGTHTFQSATCGKTTNHSQQVQRQQQKKTTISNTR